MSIISLSVGLARFWTGDATIHMLLSRQKIVFLWIQIRPLEYRIPHALYAVGALAVRVERPSPSELIGLLKPIEFLKLRQLDSTGVLGPTSDGPLTTLMIFKLRKWL